MKYELDDDLDYLSMVRMFEFMNYNPDCPPDDRPFCFKNCGAEVSRRRGLRNYYGIETFDPTYRLDTSKGRKAWKAAAPGGERVIPEDGMVWCEIFFRCHIRPKLMEYLKREGIVRK